MKAFLAAVLVVPWLVIGGLAEEANGLRLTVQKTQLDKQNNKDVFYEWDKVEKALGLKVAARNISFKDLPEGTLEYTVIVKRWGRTPELYENFSGTEKFPALIKSAEANLVVGKVPLGGWETNSNRKEFMDSIEGYQVIVKHDGKETVKIVSNAAFAKLLPKTKPGKLPK
jgi:hypothetical protein